jgi:WS/DGAT/MGAT family acyltransferase
MTALEAVMWRSEVDPLLRSHGVVLELLDRTPEWGRLVAAHEWAIGLVPRLRQRVVDDPTLIGPPAWVDTDVDLDRHLTRVELAPDDDLLGVAAAFHMDGLPRDTVQWEAKLVTGLPDGGAAYLLKLHHAMADGTAVVQLLDLLHSATSEPSGRVPATARPADVAPTPRRLAADHVRETALHSVGTAVRLASGAVRLGVGAVTHPQATARYVSSLANVTGGSPGTPSPLARRRGLRRRLAAIDLALADVRAAAKTAGASINDAFLAGILGGLRIYHEQHDVTVGDLPIALPISIRKPDDELGGNRFAGARIAGPAWQSDPIARMRLIGLRVREAREEPALDFMQITAPAVSRAPSALLGRLTASFTSSIDFQASNFRGLDRESYIAGARVERMFAFGPAPGCGAMATLVSHNDRCCIALTIDTEAYTDPDALLTAFERGFDEVLAVATG